MHTRVATLSGTTHTDHRGGYLEALPRVRHREGKLSRIFISHSSRDAQAARALKEFLDEKGHRSVFLDFDPADGIPAGCDWERELYERIRTCQAMIVICSRDSMASRWCFMEMTHARALGKVLLALRIDDTPLDGVLADRQAVDLARGKDEAYARLIHGLAAGGLDPRDAFPLNRHRPPYPGLLSFEEEDASIFFGRREEITRGLELLNRLHHLGAPRFTMVLGASGTGKSSLVRAGLVPRLRRDTEKWTVIDPFRPRADPMREFAAVLRRTGWTEIAEQVAGRTDREALADALLEVRRRSGETNAKLLVVVDQFEELLGADHRPVFLEQLRCVIEHRDAPVILLATMRSDFLEVFQSAETLRDLRYEVLSLGPLSRRAIGEIIEEPAKDRDVELEPELIATLVEDAGAPNALPLLAFTLRELWERYAQDRRITLAEYRDGLGGIQRVIGEAAENVLKTARISPDQERSLRAAFVAMIRITDDGKYARRAVKWADVPERARPLLERFVASRLLVMGSEAEDTGRTVEVAHERLFDSWSRLKRWIEENLEAISMRREIDSTTQSWQKAKQKDLLWRGARIARTRELLDDGTLLLDNAARRFIEASERQEKLRRWAVTGTVSGFALVATLLALSTWMSRQRAITSAKVADERAQVAEVERMRALSAQNFAEHERVRARARMDGIEDDEQAALLAIAPKYQDQSRRFQREATRLQQELDAWRQDQGVFPPPSEALFTLEVLRAEMGTAFLVHYGDPRSARHILIDGGPNRTYGNVLKPRLEELRHTNDPLPLRLVIATQTDIQHLGGLIALVEDLQRPSPATAPVKIQALWSNAFVPGPPETASALARIQPKGRLVAGARALGIPVNAPFTRMIAAPEAGAARVTLDEGLTITVLGPRVQWLRKFADFWVKNWATRIRGRDGETDLRDALLDYDILETFADPQIELLPSPIEIADPPNPGGLEKSIVNLASTILMLELNGKRMLLPADARSDVILSALAQAGYSDENGSMSLDLLVLPHAGSDHNVSVEFFRRIKARHYVISADGTYDNPALKTFTMLFEARRGDSDPFSIYLTYPPDEYKDGYPVADLCSLFERERSSGTSFEIITPDTKERSLGIDLLSEAAFVDRGTLGAVCAPAGISSQNAMARPPNP